MAGTASAPSEATKPKEEEREGKAGTPAAGAPAPGEPVAAKSVKAKGLSLIRGLGEKAKGASDAVSGKLQGSKAAGVLEAAREVTTCLFAPDKASRRMALVFWCSCLASIATMGAALDQVRRERAAVARAEAERRERELEEQRKRLAAIQQPQLNLGPFTIELRPKSGRPKARGVMNLAQVEVVAACDSGATCEFLKAHLDQARGELTNLLLAVERDELLSRKGKTALKQLLIDRLNRWLPRGTVVNLYFSKLVVT